MANPVLMIRSWKTANFIEDEIFKLEKKIQFLIQLLNLNSITIKHEKKRI